MNKIWLFLFVLLITMVGWSCSVNPYRKSNRTYIKHSKALTRPLTKLPVTVRGDSIVSPTFAAGTIHFNLRKPNYVILHHTAQDTCDQTLQTFTSPKREVSAHYVICKDGMVHQMLNDYYRAWHAGVARWGSISDINSVSLGIELHNDGFDSFPPTQMNALVELLHRLKKQYNIPAQNFIGHADVAPTRKEDPNHLFPWQLLAEEGFGLWYKDTASIVLPPGFNPHLNLKLLGYDMRKPEAAVIAFRRHYTGVNYTGKDAGKLSDAEMKILYSLVQQSL